MRSSVLRICLCAMLLGGIPTFGPAVREARAQSPELTGVGLQGEYFNNKDFTGFAFSRIDGAVDFDWGAGSPGAGIEPDTFSVRWTGGLQPQFSETYTLFTNATDGVRLWINGQLLVDDFVIHGTPIERSATIALVAGKQYDLRLEYFEQSGNASARLSWQSASQTRQAIPQSRLFAASQSDAARLLEQGAFGPTETDIEHVMMVGPIAWIDEQFTIAQTGYPDMPYFSTTSPPDCVYVGSDPTGPSSICNRDNYSLFQVQIKFFQNAMYGGDQLRQRVAFALSQILVVSGNEVNMAYGMTEYQQLLYTNAFGNYRDVLYQVTLNPAMGRYLDMVNNHNPSASSGYAPNENYARELLQLFSVGTYKLNVDGTPQVGTDGLPLATYDQDVVEGFAKVFTGWTYPTVPGATPNKYNPTNYIGEMLYWPNSHNTTAKELLNDVMLPARDDAYGDLNAAIDNVFNHPNVGPFISKQLIQKLATSNPSPAYVARVATVFNDNGTGVRGDLRAVVKTILTDPEARSAPGTVFGRLKDPILFAVAMLRGLHGTSDGVYLRSQMSGMSQNLFYSPSVFNYYPADNPLPGTTYVGPEFGIMNSSTSLSRANLINSIVYTTLIAPDPSVPGATGTKVDLAFLQSLATDPPAMVEKLNVVMMRGQMSDAAKNAIVTAVTAVSATDTLGRARAAAYLVATASQYQVHR